MRCHFALKSNTYFCMILIKSGGDFWKFGLLLSDFMKCLTAWDVWSTFSCKIGFHELLKLYFILLMENQCPKYTFLKTYVERDEKKWYTNSVVVTMKKVANKEWWRLYRLLIPDVKDKNSLCNSIYDQTCKNIVRWKIFHANHTWALDHSKLKKKKKKKNRNFWHPWS